MKRILLLIGSIFLLHPILSQEKSKRNDYEITSGFGLLIYQSAYNMQDSYGFEAAARSNIVGPLDWQSGIRLGFNPALPEVFGRILLHQESGAWRPEIGLESGITSRANFDDGAMLLRETREAMQTDINAFYMAIHAAPAVFKIKEKWKLSALEIDFGTHYPLVAGEKKIPRNYFHFRLGIG